MEGRKGSIKKKKKGGKLLYEMQQDFLRQLLLCMAKIVNFSLDSYPTCPKNLKIRKAFHNIRHFYPIKVIRPTNAVATELHAGSGGNGWWRWAAQTKKSALSAYEQTKHSFIQGRYGTYMKSSKLF